MKSLILFLFLSTLNFAHAQKANEIVTIYFDFNSSEISESELNKLDLFEKNKHSIVIKTIEAHTDSTGTIAYNNKLALKRLEAVLKHIDFDKSKANIIGEKKANLASNYIGSKFRKVVIDYYLSLPEIVLEEPIEDKIEEAPEDEPSLESGMEEFVKSDESTISFDLKIHFNPGTAVPLVESYPELDRLVKILQENKSFDAFLNGHVCCSDNLDISERRAGFVFNYLVKNGIQSERLQMKGHSNWEPKTDPELTEEDRISNRRVNVVFTKK